MAVSEASLVALVLSAGEESEDSARETGEECCSGITVYEGIHHRPCVACAPLTYHAWRLAGYPNLRDVEVPA